MSEQETLRDKWGNLAVTISVKAVVIESGKLWLRKNERNDWELPGGRLDEGEQPEDTIRRELREELGCEIFEPRLLDVFVWEKDFGSTSHIAIVTFLCEVKTSTGVFETVGEAGAAEFKQFSTSEALVLDNLPAVYKRALKQYENH